MTLKKIILTLLAVISLTLTLSQCKKDKCKENNKNNCNCTKQYDPVCGCNNITYGNYCEADCKGITEYTIGTCK